MYQLNHHLSILTNDQNLMALSFTQWDNAYKFLLGQIIENGELLEGRNGLYFKAITNIICDLREGFPLTQIRKLPVQKYKQEFIFDIGLNNHIDALHGAKVFWERYAHDSGFLGGSGYNRQWRQFPPSKEYSNMPGEVLETNKSTDQLTQVVELLSKDRTTRRAVVITVNPTSLNDLCMPCHTQMVFMPEHEYLDIMVTARSNDMVLGFPGDIVRYSLMLTLVAQLTNFKPRYVNMPSINSHIYANHKNAVLKMLDRPSSSDPSVVITTKPFDELEVQDISFSNYTPQGSISGIIYN